MVIALTHAAVSYALKQLLADLFRHVRVGQGHSLCQLLCDCQVLAHAQLQGLMVLDTCSCTKVKTWWSNVKDTVRTYLSTFSNAWVTVTFLAATSRSTAFSYCWCVMKKSEQRARRAGSEFSSRSSAICLSAGNCWVAKANSRALEK